MVWGGVLRFGLPGAGMAFFGLYAIHWVGIYIIVSRLSGFRWSASNRRLASVFLPLVAGLFAGWYFLPRVATVALGGAATLLSGIYSIKRVCELVPLGRLPRPVRSLLRLWKLTPPDMIA